ncbi:SDR family NAD(P)-dependent oxidoreductase [Massilia pseudoviolaceinigra]|uniref:SDR family NAD(P)-dependent oxidoreductase n=1 Tax=Massilia pseudoviolaceinigra TaxID=3057165 RepID=UPI0027966F01|nr:SDR family NAD(P)-dependent oxidoreductase [Massilia sp. CCM 9206]MDQ1919210.1 SDR family NAD(P)-dependent oxidoreductase [Massilia sp. CCM 9206]
MVNNDVKVALITGGGTGIGTAAALAFARAGYRVAVVGRRLDRLDTVVATIRHAGGEGLAIQADVANDADADTRAWLSGAVSSVAAEA